MRLTMLTHDMFAEAVIKFPARRIQLPFERVTSDSNRRTIMPPPDPVLTSVLLLTYSTLFETTSVTLIRITYDGRSVEVAVTRNRHLLTYHTLSFVILTLPCA